MSPTLILLLCAIAVYPFAFAVYKYYFRYPLKSLSLRVCIGTDENGLPLYLKFPPEITEADIDQMAQTVSQMRKEAEVFVVE